jgi:regulator of protease activity HflC (stomatin/prohibitin superfamily)
MAGLIFGIIFLLIGVGAGIWLFSASETSYQEDERGNYVRDSRGERIKLIKHPLRKFAKFAIIGGIILGIGITLLGCIASVGTGHIGIVTTFGKVEDYTFDAGMHFKAPWNSVVKMDNRVQKTTIELPCFSSDIQEVNTVYTVNYQISKTNAQNLYRDVGTGYLETVVNPTVQETVKTIIAKYTAEDLIAKRAEVAVEIETLLTTNLARYNIDVSSTAIENMDFTDSFTAAVEAKAVAAQQKLQAQIEQDRLTMEATQAAERAKVEAAAQAEVNKMNATAAKEVAEIQAEADRIVAQIGADSAEYQGKKEAAIALQRLASINGWTVVTNEETGIHELYKANGDKVTDEELAIGAQRLIEYYYTQSWDGKLPDTFIGDEDVSNIIVGKN